MECKICKTALVWGKNHGGQEENICDSCKRERSEAAAALGKFGGSVKSERKTQTSRENGKKGGRPMKYSISINNGLSDCSPEEAIEKQDWDVIVNAMDDTIREKVHNKFAPCSNLKFLREYLRRGQIVIG